MNSRIDTFVQLSQRLANFGQDTISQDVIRKAELANGWFRPEECCRAVEAIRTQMLDAARLQKWLGGYTTQPATVPKTVLVIMAGNIPLVGFFDLLCVLVSGHRCLVKPAGKDVSLMNYIVAILHDIDPEIPIDFYNGKQVPDAVIATGSNNTNRYFRSHYAGIPSLFRGSRQSIAVLDGAETEAQLAALSDDLFAYSGLGCRNVSLLFVPQGHQFRLAVPDMNPKYHNNYLQTRALLTMEGVSFVDLGGAVAVENRAFPQSLSCIHYTYYSSPAEVEAWLTEHDRELQCIVTASLAHPRAVALGSSQTPALTDYPDAVDVLAWLGTLN